MPKIRPYQPKDEAAVLQLFQLNTPEFFAPEEEQDLMDYLRTDSENYFLIEENETLLAAGGLNFLEEGKEARIAWDFVHPGHHGRGLGSKLVEHRITLAKSNPDVEKIVVRTSQMAFRFYEKQGFELVEVQKDYWAEGFDLYYMEYK